MTSRTFADAAASYMALGGEGKYLPRILARIGDKPVTEVTAGEIRFLALEIFPTAKNSTRNRHAITPCRAVMNHAHELGWCNWLRIRSLRNAPPRRYAPPDQDWLATFVEFCDRNRLLKLAALVLFMNHTGARVSEAIGLRGEHVDLEARSAILVRTKTDRHSERALSAELVRRIRMIGLIPGERVFGQRCRHNVNDRLRCVSRRAGLEYKSSHAVGRAAFATNALNMGLGIRTAMDAGGWRTARIFLEVYVHTAAAGKAVANRIDQTFPPPRRDWLLADAA
ncbi:tyrosine-type recombinase/integrase [Bosea massiliensis]|uniref:Tyrosine-type recombinase/integrase n=1 Tax=Bosea massiliensis TaxID=151419 RepID=A0ABW0NXH2_9HYPH